MMKIQNSDFYTLLPESYRNVENQCISYAMSKAVERLCMKAIDIRIFAGISELSENILDYLAIELRVPYYSQDMTREEKARIISSALPWYMNAGTKSALEKILQTVYGGGKVTEWFDYSGGQPFHFKVMVNSANNEFERDDFTETIIAFINRAKNARSILDGLGLLCEATTADNRAPFVGCEIHQNILKNGAESTITIVIGSDSLSTENENTITGGTFNEPSALVLDCGRW